MSRLKAELQSDFFVRQGCVGAIFLFFGGIIVSTGIKSARWEFIAVGVGFVAIWAILIGWTQAETIREMVPEGAIRRDGKFLPWSSFEREIEGYYYMKTGGKVLNHVDLKFQQGRVRLYPVTLKNFWELLDYAHARTKPAGSSASDSTASSTTDPSPARVVLVEPEPSRKAIAECSICSQLRDMEVGMQKAGHEAEDSFLPEAASKLINLGELEPGRNRSPELNQCPECSRYYWYKVDYEYLVYGSEDEQRLLRLSDAEGEALHQQVLAARRTETKP